jgi:hypothetical protein
LNAVKLLDVLGLDGEEQVMVAMDGKFMEPDFKCREGLDGGEEVVAMDGKVIDPALTLKVGLEGVESCILFLMGELDGEPPFVDLLKCITGQADMVYLLQTKGNAMLLLKNREQ